MTTDDTQVFHLGRIVPRSGIHRCDGHDEDHAYEPTDVAGHRFPRSSAAAGARAGCSCGPPAATGTRERRDPGFDGA